LEGVALKYQELINGYYKILAQNILNVPEINNKLEMKTEAVIKTAYFRATRRYAQWIVKAEGRKVDKLDIKGLEFKKANFPPILGDFFRNALIRVLKGTTQEEIDNDIKEFEDKIKRGDINFREIGNPTSVKTLNKYLEKKGKDIGGFSIIKKGAPVGVKAAINYNDLLSLWGLNNKHEYISQGNKIKWVYLKPNKYNITEIAFLEYDLPEKISSFINRNINKQKMFKSILLNKLFNFYKDLGWDLELNPYKKKFFEL